MEDHRRTFTTLLTFSKHVTELKQRVFLSFTIVQDWEGADQFVGTTARVSFGLYANIVIAVEGYYLCDDEILKLRGRTQHQTEILAEA